VAQLAKTKSGVSRRGKGKTFAAHRGVLTGARGGVWSFTKISEKSEKGGKNTIGTANEEEDDKKKKSTKVVIRSAMAGKGAEESA